MDETEKDPRTIIFRNFLIQIAIIIYFTLTLTVVLIFGIERFDIVYFIFMFLSIFISSVIVLRSKIVPETSYPIVFTQKFTNILKILTDVITKKLATTHPVITEFKEIIQKVIIWNLRDGRITSEFSQEVIDDAETYILDKLFPKKEKGEEEN